MKPFEEKISFTKCIKSYYRSMDEDFRTSKKQKMSEYLDIKGLLLR